MCGVESIQIFLPSSVAKKWQLQMTTAENTVPDRWRRIVGRITTQIQSYANARGAIKTLIAFEDKKGSGNQIDILKLTTNIVDKFNY
jgi:hypothetical protein